jgi:Secretion system C-terminal sorting domain
MFTNKTKNSTFKFVQFLILILFFNTSYTQQNLIANPSFETYIRCPKQYPNYDDVGVYLATPWYSPVKDSGYFATYCNSCADSNSCCSVPHYANGHCFQYARTGNAFVSMYFKQGTGNNNFRNYIQTKLLKPLQIGNCYYVEFFVNSPDNFWAGGGGVGVNNIGLLLTDTATISRTGLPPLANYEGLINANAQILQYGNPAIIDTANWVKIAGVYTAKGGEKYITIGSFVDDAHTIQVIYYPNSYSAGYNIDDVSVIPLDSMQLKAEAGRDTTIVKGDSVWIGSRLSGLTNVVWYDAANNVIDTGAPGLWVKPTSNTFYVIEQDVCGQYSRDTVYITVAALPVIIDNYKLIIDNGIQNKVENVWTTSTEINVSHFNVQRSLDGVIFETVGRVKAKGAGKYSLTPNPSPLERGVTCYYRLEVVDKNGALSYSEVKELRIENGELIISPNPAKDFISISGGSVKEVRVSDVGGRVLLVGRDKKVDIRSLVNGTYIVQIETLNGNYSIHKFIKLPN